MVKKEKVVKQYTRKSKSGKTVVVKQHTAKYDAAEDIAKQALKSKEGSGKELEDLKKKKPVAQKEEAKSPYEEYGFTKDEFKEWYEGTGSKADKKVEKALKKAMGTKAYNAFSDKAADEYKKGGAHRFFTKGLEEMKASTSTSTKSVTSSKETKTPKGSKDIPLSGFKPRQQSLINSKLQKNGSYSEEWHTTHGIDMGYTLALNKLEKSGWKRKSHKVSPEDRLSTNSVYISPDGKYKAIAITSGDILRKNHHQSIEIKKV